MSDGEVVNIADHAFGNALDVASILGTDVAILDTETTGTDREEARFVEVYIGAIIGGMAHTGRTWRIDPGIPIPKAATDVHGITDEDVEDADTPAHALEQIVGHLEDIANAGIPLVVYNAAFDLTILDREWRRHVHPAGLEVFLEEEVIVLDPLIIDKAIDRYRPGSRKLADVAQHYGLTVDVSTLHGAEADARLAGALMLELWRHPSLLGKRADHVHARLVEHAAQQAASFADYLHSRGQHDRALEVERDGGAWPFLPFSHTDHEHDYRGRNRT